MSDMKTPLNRNNRLDTMEEKLVNLKAEQLETFQQETEKKTILKVKMNRASVRSYI